MSFVKLGPWPLGVNNLAPDTALSDRELRAALDVRVTAAGDVVAFPGRRAVITGAAHSPVEFDGDLYCVLDGVLVRVNLATWATTPLRATTTAVSWSKMAGTLYGNDGTAVFSVRSGLLATMPPPRGQVSYSGAVATALPPGTGGLAAFGASLITWDDNVIYYTAPMLPGTHYPEQNFVQLPEQLVVVAQTSGGVWAASQDTTWFLRGSAMNKLQVASTYNVGASGSAFSVSRDGTAAFWMTEDGFAMADAEGTLRVPGTGRLYTTPVGSVVCAVLDEEEFVLAAGPVGYAASVQLASSNDYNLPTAMMSAATGVAQVNGVLVVTDAAGVHVLDAPAAGSATAAANLPSSTSISEVWYAPNDTVSGITAGVSNGVAYDYPVTTMATTGQRAIVGRGIAGRCIGVTTRFDGTEPLSAVQVACAKSSRR